MGNFIVWLDERRVASAGWDVSALKPGGFKKEDHELKKQGTCWLVAPCYDELHSQTLQVGVEALTAIPLRSLTASSLHQSFTHSQARAVLQCFACSLREWNSTSLITQAVDEAGAVQLSLIRNPAAVKTKSRVDFNARCSQSSLRRKFKQLVPQIIPKP